MKDIHYKCSRKDERYLNKNHKQVKSVTLRKVSCGQFYLSILIDRPNGERKTKNKSVGIDLGIKDFVTTSDGEVFGNPHFKKSQTNRLKRLQRQLSRKVKGSNNRNKARLKYARLHKRISDRKDYYLHQIANMLINENQVICMEDLNVKGMLRNHNLAESVSEMNFGEFKRIMTYKSNWYGRELVLVGRFYPSSKTCHHCGHVKRDLKLSDRRWVCPECGEVLDRDYNAACNILDEGKRIIGLSSPEFTLVDYPTVDDRLRNERLKSCDRLKQEKNEFH